MTPAPDPLQLEIARITLYVARQFGFALGGGVALAAHGVVDRPTEDVDIFTDVDSGSVAELRRRFTRWPR
jgi:Nucleotidyl transferase AbiEii toxin, Type IV TA system